MARFNQATNSFTAGEVSPRMYGRSDLPQYFQSVSEMYNMLPYVQGGSYRRPGAFNVRVLDNHAGWYGSWSILAASTGMRLFPLMMSDGKRYLICITPGDPTVSSSDAGTDDHWQVISVTEGWGCVLANVNISSEFGASGYSLAELPTIQFAQIGDFLILTCPTKPPVFFYKSITGNAYADGSAGYFIARTIEKIPSIGSDQYSAYANAFPFSDVNVGNIRGQGTLTASAATGNITLTASVAIFLSTHVGTYFKLSAAGSTGYCYITGYTSTTVLSATVVMAVPTTAVGTAAGTSWEERSWSNARGWPASVCGFQQRLYWGGNTAKPDTVWATTQGNIFQLLGRKFEQDPAFAIAITNANAFNFAIASTEPNSIQWLSAGKSLFIGTFGREYVAQGSSGSLGPLDIEINAESAYGSIAVQPVRFDSALYYVQRSGKSIRQLEFNFLENAYKGDNVLEAAEHIVSKSAAQHTTFSNPQLQEFTVQMNENPIMWAIDNNGGLIGGVISKSNKMVAWSYHELGGNLSGETPKVKSICALHSGSGKNDNLYMVVNRTVNSVTGFSIEQIGHEFSLNTLFNSSADFEDKMIYMDNCWYQVLGAPGTSFTGFTNLKSAVVDVIADGVYIGQKTISAGGTLTLSSNATEAIAGYAYTSRLTLLDAVPPSPVGSAVGQHKKINFVTMKFYRTISAKFGRSTSLLESITFPTVGGLNTCDIRKSLPFGFDRSTSVVISQAEPLPMAVSSVVSEGAADA